MRLYKLLLLLYPASFRDRHGKEMAAIFAESRREARGTAAVAGLWLDAIADSLRNGLAARPILDQVDHVQRQAGDVGQLPCEGGLSSAGIAEHGDAPHRRIRGEGRWGRFGHDDHPGAGSGASAGLVSRGPARVRPG